MRQTLGRLRRLRDAQCLQVSVSWPLVGQSTNANRARCLNSVEISSARFQFKLLSCRWSLFRIARGTNWHHKATKIKLRGDRARIRGDVVPEALGLGLIQIDPQRGAGWRAREIQDIARAAEDAGFEAAFCAEVNTARSRISAAGAAWCSWPRAGSRWGIGPIWKPGRPASRQCPASRCLTI